MEQNVNQRYIDEYLKNEVDANKKMSVANAFGGFILTVLWLAYLFKFFPTHPNIYLIVNILFPAAILVLFTPLIYLRTKHIEKPNYKYFVIFSFVMVITLINIALPKHGILAWAICVFMVNHYYNPKFGLKVFISVLVLMLFTLYASMFVGEYDPYTLGDGVVVIDKNTSVIVYPTDELGNYFLPDFPSQRFEMLHRMLQMGENRYLKSFLFYYIPRAITVVVLFFVSNSLNLRTNKLLMSEIRVNSEQQKVSTELTVAKDIQLATLPSEFATTEDVEIMAELKAAKEVGGDFYDYFNLGNDYVAVVIGDVSGKGIPAAMFMMKTITCFKNYVSYEKSPSQILKEVNKTIYEGNTSQMFVTCFLAIINTHTGEMRFSNAGHNPPIIGHDRNYRYLKCNSGFILGGLPDAFVVDESVTLENGDSLTLYTDGITEARDSDGKFYGEERLLKFFNSRSFTGLVHLHHELKDDIASFVKDAEQADDMTYLTIKYHGDKYFYDEKLFGGTKENMPLMLDFIRDFSDKYELPEAFKNNLLIVGDELISNIINYGYKDKDGDVFLRLLFNTVSKEFVLTIIDTGVKFNQLDVNNSPISGEAKDQKIGGLGILIVKNIMTECAYDYINGKNILTLKKKL